MRELSKFVEEAHGSHEFIQSVLQQYFDNELSTGVEGGSHCRMILEKLKKLKASSDGHSAERLLEQIESKRKEYERRLGDSERVQQEIETEHERVCALEKRKSKTNKRTATALLICSTVAATMVGQPLLGVAAGMIIRPQVSKASSSRTKKEDERHENALKAHYSMEDDMIVTIAELGSIKFLIHKVLNEIVTILRSIDGAINKGEVGFAIKTIKNKMETFRKQINKLNTEAAKFVVRSAY